MRLQQRYFVSQAEMLQRQVVNYYRLARQIPGGFGKVFQETKNSYYLWEERNKGKILTRRQQLVLKKNFDDLGKLAVFAALQSIPVVGTVPMIVALTYPRLLLTSQFWSDEQKDMFQLQEYGERCLYTLELVEFMSNRQTSFSSSQICPLVCLSREHINLLAGANSVYGHDLMYRITPKFLTLYIMERIAAFICKDDNLLRSEGLDDMCITELREALLQRGIIPLEGDVSEFRESLDSWLQAHKNIGNKPSYILHAVAMGQIRDNPIPQETA